MTDKDKISLKKLTEEFSYGFEKLQDIKKGIVIFGSARTPDNDEYYKLARDLSYKLAERGFSIITGAGMGIMEACNKGACEAGGTSVGLNIELPQYQEKNKYINVYAKFKHFYTRKVMFAKYSFASIAFPGGYGTLDEIFDQLAILQNEKIFKRPLILVGEGYYNRLERWLRSEVYHRYRNINNKDLNLFKITDDIEEIVNIIEKEYNNKSKKFFI